MFNVTIHKINNRTVGIFAKHIRHPYDIITGVTFYYLFLYFVFHSRNAFVIALCVSILPSSAMRESYEMSFIRKFLFENLFQDLLLALHYMSVFHNRSDLPYLFWIHQSLWTPHDNENVMVCVIFSHVYCFRFVEKVTFVSFKLQNLMSLISSCNILLLFKHKKT